MIGAWRHRRAISVQLARVMSGQPRRSHEHRIEKSPYHLRTFTISSAHVSVALVDERNLNTSTDGERPLSNEPGNRRLCSPCTPRDTAWG